MKANDWFPPEAAATAKDLRSARHMFAQTPLPEDPFKAILDAHAARVLKRIRKPKVTPKPVTIDFDYFASRFWEKMFNYPQVLPETRQTFRRAFEPIVREILWLYATETAKAEEDAKCLD